MIGIVLVSHSFELAHGAEVLSRMMADSEVRIAAAGGLETPDKAIGTDPMRILHAIEAVYSADGVLIFVDMGSALLSAEFAIQMLDEEKQPHVIISDAPFIEGAVCAAVQARLRTPLPLILKELKTALRPKQEQLGTTSSSVLPETTTIQPAAASEPAEKHEYPKRTGTEAQAQSSVGNLVQPTRTLQFTVSNTYGIHARPAARITALAGKYPSLTITVKKLNAQKEAVSALSVNSIALLGIRQGDGIVFSVTGDTPESFCAELEALAGTQFGDSETPAAKDSHTTTATQANTAAPYTEASETAPACNSVPNARTEPPKKLTGLIGSSGIAFGAARFLPRSAITVPDAPTDTPDTEWERFLDAVETVKTGLQSAALQTKAHTAAHPESITAQTPPQTDAESNAAAIFEAHIFILEDPMLTAEVKTGIYTRKISAAAAWKAAMMTLQQSYRTSDSPYLRERVCDLEDIEYRVLSTLLGIPEQGTLSAHGIVIAEEVTPQQTAQFDPAVVKGVCTVTGSPASHTAILARSFGIPALMGVNADLLSIPEGTPLILDAESGTLFINPDPETEKFYRQRLEERHAQERTAAEHRYEPAVTRGGKIIVVAANIGTAAEAQSAVENGADGVGLLRTEFLFLNRSVPPSEEEQYAAYCEIARIMDGRPLIIRTLDAGGDKDIPYLNLPKDENPFLGYRAIRISLTQTALFRTQLRAIIRTAQIYPVRLMFPMISSIEELDAAYVELHRAQEELQQRSIDVSKQFPVGMMMEVPAAAILADQFAKKADFFSIGTNDLTQYTLAAERGNSRVAHLYAASHPAVLQLIKNIAAAAHQAGKPVGVCGEFAADPEGAHILCALGIDELSVASPAIPRLKALIRSLP